METIELLEEVRMRLLSLESRAAVAESAASSAKAAMEAARSEAAAAEKRAQDAERERDDLKTRYEGAEHETRRLAPECAACPGRQAVDDLTLKLAEARRAVTAFEGQRDHAIALERDVRGALATCQRDLEAAREKLRTAQEAFRSEVATRSETIRRERAEWAEDVRRRETAESALAERNREAGEWETCAGNREREAASLRAQLAERDERIKSLGETQRNDGAEIRALRDRGAAHQATLDELAKIMDMERWPRVDLPIRAQANVDRIVALEAERDALRAQVESLRGGAEPKPTPEELRAAQNTMTIGDVVLKPCPCDYCRGVRNAWIHSFIASLPSPKTGRWKCRRCGKEQKMNPNYNLIAAWIWNGAEWRHYCPGESRAHAGDRIGDAPEVTP